MNEYMLPERDLYRLLTSAKCAAAPEMDDASHPLADIRLSVTGEDLTAMATNRYVLLMNTTRLNVREGETVEPCVFTVPPRIVADLKSLRSSRSATTAVLTVTDEGVTVIAGGQQLDYPAPRTDYPAVGKLMAQALERVGEEGPVEGWRAYSADSLGMVAKVRREAGLSTSTAARVLQVPMSRGVARLLVTFPDTRLWMLLMDVRTPHDDEERAQAVAAAWASDVDGRR